MRRGGEDLKDERLQVTKRKTRKRSGGIQTAECCAVLCCDGLIPLLLCCGKRAMDVRGEAACVLLWVEKGNARVAKVKYKNLKHTRGASVVKASGPLATQNTARSDSGPGPAARQPASAA